MAGVLKASRRGTLRAFRGSRIGQTSRARPPLLSWRPANHASPRWPPRRTCQGLAVGLSAVPSPRFRCRHWTPLATSTSTGEPTAWSVSDTDTGESQRRIFVFFLLSVAASRMNVFVTRLKYRPQCRGWKYQVVDGESEARGILGAQRWSRQGTRVDRRTAERSEVQSSGALSSSPGPPRTRPCCTRPRPRGREASFAARAVTGALFGDLAFRAVCRYVPRAGPDPLG